MVSLQPRPHSNQIAIGISNPHQESEKGIELLDLDTGNFESITKIKEPDINWQSMFWSPDGSKLLISAINAAQRWLEWQFWDGQSHQVINQFLPAREQLFYLHFFEQFRLSHPILSTDNKHFYFSAYEPPHKRREFPPKPWVYRGSFESKNEFERLHIGLFPVLSP